MSDNPNEFYWSYSRSVKFAECPRAYYYHYYGAAGGDLEGADPQARELFILRGLISRYAWRGSIVHRTIQHILTELGRSRELSYEQAVEYARKLMRAEWYASSAKSYRENLSLSGFYEHEYGIRVPSWGWRELFGQIEKCLKNFYSSQVYAGIRSIPAERWLIIEEPVSFDFEGTPIRLIMDLALRGWPSSGDGQQDILIVDWKTGQKRPQDTIQLLCYALYAHSRWGAEPARLVCRLEYLGAGNHEIIEIDNNQIEAVKEKIRRSIAAMRSAIRYPLLNLAVEEDFPKIDDRRTCLRCNFRAVCKPELKKEN